MTLRWQFSLGVAVATLQLFGCGEVTSTDQQLVGRGPAAAADAGELLDVVGQERELSTVLDASDALPAFDRLADEIQDQPSMRDAAVDSSLSCLTACEPCARPDGLDGPPYQMAAQCAKVIACARAGGDSFNAWQTCHASTYYFGSGGLHCAAAAAAAGCL